MDLLIVDDHQIFRKSFILLLKTILTSSAKYIEADCGKGALQELKKQNFDSVFIDVSMPGMNGIELCKLITKDYPKVPVVVLTQCDNEDLIWHFFEIGVHSFLTKDASISDVTKALENIKSGKKFFPQEIHRVIQKKVERAKAGSRPKLELTHQEKLLIRFLQKGFTSKEIAKEMDLTVKTVDTYRERLLQKTKTGNVAQLISFGFETGILL